MKILQYLKEGNVLTVPLGFILGVGIASTSTILNHNPYGPEYAFFDALWPGLLGMMVMSYYAIDGHAFYHAWLIEKKHRSPNHLEAWLFRALLFIGADFLLHAYNYDLQKFTYLLIFCAFWFLLVFNPSLNKHRNKLNSALNLDFFYIAKKDDGSWLDGVFNNFKYGGKIIWFLSLVLALVFGYLYIK